ncbi:DMT family transporter [Desulfobacter sp. UBA2225]|uniref:DMT family transporter n=1 Tax=Desulfobacter sp. UBA2225 TaxID=1961413 RepID=UPI00257DD203|nr:DMT family transporter [Desulfobacter sp. UBA2225]
MENRSRDIGIFALLILTFLIWSNSFIAIKLLLARMTAFDLLRLRFIPVAVISLGLIALFYRDEARAIWKAHPWRVTLGGLLMVISYNLMLNSGMRYVQPNAASLLIALNPLITLLLAVRFLGEPFTPRRLLGTVVTFAGLALVVLLGRVGGGIDTWIALDKVPYILLVLGGPVSWAAATIIIKPALRGHSPLAFNFVSLAIGGLPLFFFIDRPFVRIALSLRPLEYGAAAFLSIACTILAFTFWNIAVKHWQASNVSLFVYLNPPLTALFTYLFFGIGITLYFFLGGVIMLAGIMIATTGEIRPENQVRPGVS